MLGRQARGERQRLHAFELLGAGGFGGSGCVQLLRMSGVRGNVSDDEARDGGHILWTVEPTLKLSQLAVGGVGGDSVGSTGSNKLIIDLVM
jgi:hypothetical protein